ncbi:hypothetical protein K493DRAFT_301560 [Basidiobolus meristosporus CBS 931.73]|uniref:Uncharacterized protein n=1 Tax=Basidiobolus meristosporus CBS 931.73 TaxID=1314790 RepID=A0A1Y1YB78_9FUNG|nr:hypothetical protein K493DRAFT_301560 [Basidiobolus meristosporus CBS 931.73]|eukprot:ORX95301.1 hypothetical protein K493DRAFT_301560 [Basidiobolus meristosporus CBS 931.73]
MRHFRNGTLVLFSLAVTLGETLASNSTAAYDPTKDYFPVKVKFESQAFAKFNITYHNSWIFLQYPNRERRNYVLYQHGTPKPQHLDPTDIPIEIPLGNVNIEYSSATSFLEMLGLRDHIINVKPVSISPACLDSKNFTYGTQNATFTPKRTIRGPYVINIEAMPGLKPLVKLELLKFYALFFNKEKEAHDVIKKIEDNYECIKNRVAAAKEKSKPKVAWITTARSPRYGVMYSEYINSYLNSLLEDADAQPLFPYEGDDEYNGPTYSPAFTTAKLREIIRSADILVDMTAYSYENATFPSASDVLRYYGLSETNTTLKFIKNKAIYRVDKRQTKWHRNEWDFESPVMPDAVLEDMANMAHPGLQENYSFHWMRNVFDQDKLSNLVVTNCPFPTKPLESVAYTCSATNFSSIGHSSAKDAPGISPSSTSNTAGNQTSSHEPKSHSGYGGSTHTGPYVGLAFMLALALL